MSLEVIFGSTGQVTWLQECARAVLIFFYGLALVRLSGRRVFGKWAALDIVVSIIVGSNLSRTLTGGAELWGTLAATTLIMVLHWILAYAAARSTGWSRILEGRAIGLGTEGKLDDATRIRHAVSEADLQEALRGVGLDDRDGARLIVLEPSGKISVLKAQ